MHAVFCGHDRIGSVVERDSQIKSILDDIVNNLPEPFLMQEIMSKVPVEDRTPYVIVAFQECERMNGLTAEIRRSLKELDLGLKVSQRRRRQPPIISNGRYWTFHQNSVFCA